MPENQTDTKKQTPRPAVGPTSIEGVEANDLPNGGRGPVETDPGRELDRTPPHHTGEVVDSTINNDIGVAGHPDTRRAEQEDAGPRRHQGDK